MTRLSIITVTYNSEKYLKEYLKSIEKYLPEDSEVIILDSGSVDNTVSLIKAEDLFNKGRIKLIEKKENVGYGKGNNLAARISQGNLLFLLNPDTEILDNALNKLLDYANGKDFGIIAPQLIEPSGKVQPTVRKSPTLLGAVREYWMDQKGSFEGYAPKGNNPVEVECVLGAAMLIKKDVFLDIQGFDERFFMYFEDIDLCRRVKERGLGIFYLPNIQIRHQVGGSKESKKLDWIKESEKMYFGSVQSRLIGLVGRVGHKLKKG